ncbi:unnamed protein product, partial [Hapterophycus canaliculatus]
DAKAKPVNRGSLPSHRRPFMFVALFQRVNGLDVMLFGLIVYEYLYGKSCHEAYKGRAYVSYPDSGHDLQPARCGHVQHGKATVVFNLHLRVG